MAYFAQIDDNNVVTKVIYIDNSVCLDENGEEQESLGIDFCRSANDSRWVQTSYNRTFRKNYASIGYVYDETNDAFVPPQPFPSWILNEITYRWEPPVPFPADGKAYNWDESVLRWVELER